MTDELTARRKAHRPPRSRQTQPNERAQRCAGELQQIAPFITISLDRCHELLGTIGITGGSDTEKVSGSSSGSSTERDAELSHELRSWREELRDQIRLVERSISDLRHLATRHLPAEAPAYVSSTLCGDAHHGRQGAGEWARPRCTELPVRDGLCAADLERERRWRKAEDLPPRNVSEAG